MTLEDLAQTRETTNVPEHDGKNFAADRQKRRLSLNHAKHFRIKIPAQEINSLRPFTITYCCSSFNIDFPHSSSSTNIFLDNVKGAVVEGRIAIEVLLFSGKQNRHH